MRKVVKSKIGKIYEQIGQIYEQNRKEKWANKKHNLFRPTCEMAQATQLFNNYSINYLAPLSSMKM